jgi:hypothetical protein
VLGLLDRLCKFHHYRKTYQGWAWSTGGARGRSCPPTTPATLVILVSLITRRKPWRRLRPEPSSIRGSLRKLTVPFDGDFERGLFALVEDFVRSGFQR